VWNNYFHAFATARARSVAVFLYFLQCLTLEIAYVTDGSIDEDYSAKLNNFHKEETATHE
jgi:hypothetical protein